MRTQFSNCIGSAQHVSILSFKYVPRMLLPRPSSNHARDTALHARLASHSHAETSVSGQPAQGTVHRRSTLALCTALLSGISLMLDPQDVLASEEAQTPQRLPKGGVPTLLLFESNSVPIFGLKVLTLSTYTQTLLIQHMWRLCRR